MFGDLSTSLQRPPLHPDPDAIAEPSRAAAAARNAPFWNVPGIDIPDATVSSRQPAPQDFEFHGASFRARFAAVGAGRAALEDEVAVLKAIGVHPNVQTLVGKREINGSAAIVFEHDGCIGLDEAMRKLQAQRGLRGGMDAQDRTDILRGLAKGILSGASALHSAGYCVGHLDLEKLSLRKQDMEPTVCDFSAAAKLGMSNPRRTETSGNAAIVALLDTLHDGLGLQAGGPDAACPHWAGLIAALSEPRESLRLSPRAALATENFFAPPASRRATENFRAAVFDEARPTGDGPRKRSASGALVAADCPQAKRARVDATLPSSSRELVAVSGATVPALPERHMLDSSIGMLTSFANKMLLRVAGELIAKYSGAQGLFRELNDAMRFADLSVANRMTRLLDILERNHRQIPESCRDYTTSFVLCLRPIERLLRQVDASSDATNLDKAREVLAALDSMLEHLQGGFAGRGGLADRVRAATRCVADGLDVLEGVSRLPADARLGDFLNVLMTSGITAGLMAPHTLACLSQVEAVLAAADRLGAPALGLMNGARASDKLASLMDLMRDPAMLSQLDAHLPAGWQRSPAFAAILQVRDFPLQGSPGEQVQWLSAKCRGGDAASAVKPFVEAFATSLIGEDRTQAFLKTILSLADPKASHQDKAMAVVSQLGSSLSFGTALSMVKPLVSAIPWAPEALAAVSSVVHWYGRQPAGLSWEDTFKRFTTYAAGEVLNQPAAIARLVPVPGAHHVAHAIGKYMTAPAGMSWYETMSWAGEQATQHPEIRGHYDRYMQLSLLWKLGAMFMKSPTLEQQEVALAEIAGSLRQYLSARGHTHLQKIASLLPCVPALIEIGPQCMALPAGASRTQWLEGVIDIVAHTRSPALQQLGRQLQGQLEDCLSDSLMAGVEAMTATAGSALSGAAQALRRGASSIAGMGDPLSLQFMLAGASTVPPLPASVQRQELQAKRLQSDFDAQSAHRTATPITAPTTSGAVGTGDLSHIADDFNPFYREVKPQSYRQVADGVAVATAWFSTSCLLYANARQWHADMAAHRANAAAGPAIESFEMTSLFDSATDRQGGNMIAIAMDAPSAITSRGSTIARWAKPAGLVVMTGLSIGASVAYHKTYGADADGIEEEEAVAASQLAVAELARTGRGKRSHWEDSMWAMFDFSDYSALIQATLNTGLDRSLTASSALAADDIRTARFLIRFDATLAELAGAIVPDSTSRIAQMNALNVERANVRQSMAQQMLVSPTLMRSAPLALADISLDASRQYLAYELQPIDQDVHAAALSRHYDVTARLPPTVAPGPAYVLRPTVGLGLLTRAALSRPSGWRPAASTTTSSPTIAPPVLSVAEARAQAIYAAGIATVDQKMSNYMIRCMVHGNRNSEGLRSDLRDLHKTIRTNIGNSLLQLQKLTDAEATGSQFSNYTREEKIMMEQVAKVHATLLYVYMENYRVQLFTLGSETAMRRMGSQAAVVNAKAVAARLTFTRYAMLDDLTDNLDTVPDDQEFCRLFNELRGERPDIAMYASHTAALAFHLFTGGADRSVTAQVKRTVNGLDGNAALTWDQRLAFLEHPDDFFPWQPKVMKAFLDAERANDLSDRLTRPPPAGFLDVNQFKRSNEFATWKTYFEQYDNYFASHLGHDAGLVCAGALFDAGLSEYELALTPRGATVLELACAVGDTDEGDHRHRYRQPAGPLRPLPGLLGVIQQIDGKVLVLTSIDGQARSKLISAADAKLNPVLNHIVNVRTYSRRSAALDYAGGYTDALLRGAGLTDNLLKLIWPERDVLQGRGDFPVLLQRWRNPDLIDVEGKTLLDVADEIMKASQTSLANASRATNRDPSAWHTAASNFLPFFSMSFELHFNPAYTPTTSEVTLNFLAVAAALLPMGVNLARLGSATYKVVQTQVMKQMTQGLRGTQLVRATIQGVLATPNIGNLGLQTGKILGIAAYDLLSSLPFPIAMKPLKMTSGVNGLGVRPIPVVVPRTVITSGVTRYRMRPVEMESRAVQAFIANPSPMQLARVTGVTLAPLPRVVDPMLTAMNYSWWNTRAIDNIRFFSVQPGRDKALRSNARHLISAGSQHNRAAADDRLFAFELLARNGDIPSNVASTSTSPKVTRFDMRQALRSQNTHEFMASSSPVESTNGLLQIRPGALVAFVNGRNRVQQLLVSIGGGWFSGMRPSLIDPSLGSVRSLVMAEELGKFVDKKIMGGRYSVVTGSAKWSDIRRTPEPRTASRVHEIFGLDGHFDAVGGEMSATAHGMPFNVYHMSAPELAHAYLGLRAAAGLSGPLSNVQLISCQGAKNYFGSDISTGQTLADSLHATVTAFEGKVNGITARQTADGGAAHAKAFRPRLVEFDAAHPEPRTSGEAADRVALVKLIVKDTKRHEFWHGVSATIAEAISRVRAAAPARPARQALQATETPGDRLIDGIASFIVGRCTSAELLQASPVPESEGNAVLLGLTWIENWVGDLSDDDSLSACLEIVTQSPGWRAILGDKDN